MRRMILRPIIFFVIIIVAAFFVFNFTFKPTQDSLTVARDLSGQWNGKAVFTDKQLDCLYNGDMTINFVQNGNQLNGNFNLVVESSQPQNQFANCINVGSNLGYLLGGTVSASAIDLFIANTDKLIGSFTTDIMTLRWEPCQGCVAGPPIKFQGPINLKRQ